MEDTPTIQATATRHESEGTAGSCTEDTEKDGGDAEFHEVRDVRKRRGFVLRGVIVTGM